MLQQYRVELSDLGVTPIQAGVLLYLQRYPGSYCQSMADDLGRDASWIGVVVRDLHRQGWLKKQRAPCDDSYVFLRVTRKGAALARAITRDVLLRLGELTAK
jgi:DNA-binding MarR family transcriptional regulator